MGKWRQGGSSWWSEKTNGVQNWIGITLIAAMLAASGIGIAALTNRPSVTASAPYTSSPLPTPSATATPAPVALFIGDSYTSGTGASKESLRWSSLVAKSAGFREANYGRGGTGFVSTAGKEGCGLESCPAYPDMIAQAKTAGVTPSVVFIAGGQNDANEWLSNEQSDVRDAIASTYTRARQDFPDARIIAVGPSFLGGTARWQSDMDAAVRDAAATVQAEYVSLLDPDVLEDSAVELGDGAHVNDLGHRAIADRVLSLLGAPSPQPTT